MSQEQRQVYLRVRTEALADAWRAEWEHEAARRMAARAAADEVREIAPTVAVDW